MAVTEAMIEAAATALGDFESFHDEPSVYRDMAKAALEAAEKARWQPIETAKTGTPALYLHSAGKMMVYNGIEGIRGLTAWQPLPSPPEST